MNKIKVLVAIIAILLFSVSAYAKKERQKDRVRETISGKVIKVSDGDTITVLARGNRQVKIRLYGIDCPEKKQEFGERARMFTDKLVAGERVQVEVYEIDRYQRNVGIVKTKDNVNLNYELVKAGFAWTYEPYCKALFCEDFKNAEKKARRDKKGLWKDRNPTPPWKYRKDKRSKEF